MENVIVKLIQKNGTSALCALAVICYSFKGLAESMLPLVSSMELRDGLITITFIQALYEILNNFVAPDPDDDQGMTWEELYQKYLTKLSVECDTHQIELWTKEYARRRFGETDETDER